eukprot:7676131-Lingulodinium_polyedra.AAC.1
MRCPRVHRNAFAGGVKFHGPHSHIFRARSYQTRRRCVQRAPRTRCELVATHERVRVAHSRA